MNRATYFLMAAGVWLMPSLNQAEIRLPTGSAGEVTLDWRKFNEIWTKMQDMEKKIDELQKPEHRPPVPFTMTKAAYKGKSSTGRRGRSC